MSLYLGIEIGGTKLQASVGRGDGSTPLSIRRVAARPEGAAAGIRQQIADLVRPLLAEHTVEAIGIGFGGPVDPRQGRTIVSHQVQGWEDFPLAAWCQKQFGRPAVLANDSDSAGLAEARFGAGRGASIVFYSNVGSGIGGALILDGAIHSGSRGIAAELGHLRPGIECVRSQQTVEGSASGWAIAADARQRLAEALGIVVGGDPLRHHAAEEIRNRCDGEVERLDTRLLAEAAQHGNIIAREAFHDACRVFGWALAQMITLLAPEVVVIGGGVALAGEELFLAPVREEVARYVFPPLQGTYRIVPAALDELVVLQGALALAAAAGGGR